MSPAYELMSPIHINAIMVAALFGTGPESTPSLATNISEVATKANIKTSGIAESPFQYATAGAATQPTIPIIEIGR
jgi:hypothetical protein